jgi:F-type H+-transporting ATPase subunit b
MKALLTSLAMLAAAGSAWAAEVHGEAPPATPFAGNVGNALWTVVIFVLVVVVLGKFAWGPLLRSLQAREDFIRQALEQAKRDRDEAEARLREYGERLAQARAEASAIVDEGRRDADAVRRRIEEETRQEANRMIERAKREIGIAKETAIKDLYTLGARLATDAASRILRRELKPQDHERLVAESIQALERREPS